MAIEPPTSTELQLFRRLSTVADVAKLLDTTRRRLSFHLYSRKRPHYTEFTIPKRTGGVRRISAPPPILACFQRKILSCLTAIALPKKPVHGFALNRSVATNAKPHVGAAWVLNVDLLDFFPSIHFGRVLGLFRAHPFKIPSGAATVLAQLCCFRGRLPQGAPTSPIISNLICRGLDRDFDSLCRKNDCRYTRYADDITVSTMKQAFPGALVAGFNLAAPNLGPAFVAVLRKHDFSPNPVKTRLSGRSRRQEVTGLVVNHKVNVPRTFVRNLRAAIHDIEKSGLTAAQTRFHKLDSKARYGGTPALVDHLRGKVAYLGMIKGHDDPVYARCALAFARTCDAGAFPVLGKAATEIALVEHALWVIVGYDRNGHEVAQGTAFYLEGEGMISARHVFDEPDAATWKAIRGTHPFDTQRITAMTSTSHVDIALVETAAHPTGALRPAPGQCATGSTVAVLGFPAWRTIADRAARTPAQITQQRPVSGVDTILTSATIMAGNSGGPLLDQRGLVVAVVVAGNTHATPNSGIALRHLQDAKAGVRKGM